MYHKWCGRDAPSFSRLPIYPSWQPLRPAAQLQLEEGAEDAVHGSAQGDRQLLGSAWGAAGQGGENLAGESWRWRGLGGAPRRFLRLGEEEAGARAEGLQDVPRVLDELGAVPDQGVGADRLLVEDPPRH